MSKSHQVLLRVTFDRPCTQAEAVVAVKENIHGDFYPFFTRDKAPEVFWVRSVARTPKRSI
jgi:hypothetical protein